VQQATAITATEVSTLRSLMPTNLVPPIAGPKGELIRPDGIRLLPNPPTHQEAEALARSAFQMQSRALAPPLAPCAPVNSETTDGNGVTTYTSDYTACTDGFGGRIIIVYQYTQTAWRYDITFDHFFESFSFNTDTYRYSINGMWYFSGTLDTSGNSYTFAYKTGTGGVSISSTKNGAPLASATLTHDTTCKWQVTNATPVIATFTIYGSWGYSGTFENEGGAVTSGNYTFSIPQATPLVWNYDSSSSTNCYWPVSGVINIRNNNEALSFTFTSTCGQAILNPGNKTVTF
jgi:hypothetical protein